MTIAEINRLQAGMPVPAMQGTVAKCWPTKAGTNEVGDWTKQMLLVQDTTGKIIITVWNHAETFAEGATLWFTGKQTKQGWAGLKVRIYQDNSGESRLALDASKACEISPYPPAAEPAPPPPPAPAAAPAAPPTSHTPAGERGLPQAMAEAGRLRNAYILAFRAADSFAAAYARQHGEPPPSELYCGAVTSIKISLERGGFVGGLPAEPLEDVTPGFLAEAEPTIGDAPAEEVVP